MQSQSRSDMQSQSQSKKKKKVKALILTADQENSVIEWLKVNECFFNNKNAYKDTKMKNRLWTAKEDELHIETVILKTWFNSMRTRFGKLTKTASADSTADYTLRGISGSSTVLTLCGNTSWKSRDGRQVVSRSNCPSRQQQQQQLYHMWQPHWWCVRSWGLRWRTTSLFQIN